ncbi:DUF5985 family protein [Prosthecobacter sp.]|uniref:DUF5985 family protein n=1 Tax=Prosthecobacter sp. TaxID=1965333 RepID=UPI003784FBC6
MLNQFLAGAATISLIVISLFFLRFWKRTGDRLFLFFAGAFVFLMIERVVRAVMAVETAETEWTPYVYMIRLVAFVLIIIAIVDKNRRS